MEQLSLDFQAEFDEESMPDAARVVLPVLGEDPPAAQLNSDSSLPIRHSPVPSTPWQAPRSLADVLIAVEAATDLKPSRRRDLMSAPQSFCRLCRLPPASVPAQPREIRALLRELHPAAFNMSAKRFSNMIADLALALDIANGRPSARSRQWPLRGEWQGLWDVCPSIWVKMQLSRFMRWCADQGILPFDVEGETLTSFLAYCDENDLKLEPAQLRRRVAHSWNKCADQVASWPRTKLPLVPARIAWTLPWADFHPVLCDQVDVWLEHRANPDLRDDDGPSRPLRPLTLKERRF
jgi:hypothetical protein